MSDMCPCNVIDWAEINGQQVELLPARTVLSCWGAGHGSGDSWGGDEGHDNYNHDHWGGEVGYDGLGGDGGDGNIGGPGVGGDGGDAYAFVTDNYNYGLIQINIAIADSGDGGDGAGGDVSADGGDGVHQES